MRITNASRKAIEYACMHFHYAKAIPVNPLGYNIYNGKNEWCGTILYAVGANNLLASSLGFKQGQVLELVRVALNGKQEATSQAVAMTLRQLKKDCPLCQLVVSYADCDQNHLGTIYQATNWIYVCTSSINVKDCSCFINGKKMHGKAISDKIKHHGGLRGLTREQWIHKYLDKEAIPHTTKGKRKYLMPLNKRVRKVFQKYAKPYPKTDKNWQKIDRNIYKTEK